MRGLEQKGEEFVEEKEHQREEVQCRGKKEKREIKERKEREDY